VTADVIDASAMNGMSPKLYRENQIELMVLQALYGVLSSNIKALTLEYVERDVVVHFLLGQESEVDREEIEENFPTEISVLTLGTDIGEVLAMPVIEFVGEHEPGYVPPGRGVLKFRD
jgi:hypothetical protein